PFRGLTRWAFVSTWPVSKGYFFLQVLDTVEPGWVSHRNYAVPAQHTVEQCSGWLTLRCTRRLLRYKIVFQPSRVERCNGFVHPTSLFVFLIWADCAVLPYRLEHVQVS